MPDNDCSQGELILMLLAKTSLTRPLALAFASLLLVSGHLAAAPETTHKKPAATPAKKEPARKDAAKKEAPKTKQATKSQTATSVGAKPAPAKAAKAVAPAKKTVTAGTHKKPSAKAETAKKSSPAQKALSLSATAKLLPLPRPRPDSSLGGQSGGMVLASAETQPVIARPSLSAPITTTTSSADLAATKEALALIRKGKISDAMDVKKSISDPAAAKLIEWVYLRSPYSSAGFERYAAFIHANPTWPSLGMLQRRAEGSLWDDKRDPATTRAYFAENPPRSGKGRLALARALLAQGDQAGAQRLVREAWRRDVMAADGEQQALDLFANFLTEADHRARMYRLLYAQEEGAAMRAAKRLGSADMAVAKARIALNEKSEKSGALLDAVPAEARGDPNYVMGRIQWLRRNDKIAEAAQLMLTMPRDPDLLHDTDEWWVERRLLARKVLDLGDAQTAYRIARDAAPPEKENGRVEQLFTAGWIALRFLNDPRSALPLFAGILQTTEHPTSLARAYYWQGRALEAMGRNSDARAQYQMAARSTAAYYGQIARAKLGMADLDVPQPPKIGADERAALRNVDVVRAVDLLYAAGERELVITFVADLAERATDMGPLLAVADLCAEQRDARALLYLGKNALARGLPFEYVAFPTVGIPNVTPIGPELDRSIVFAITRQESAFNQKDVSSAKAMGLMQVTGEAGRDTAKRFGAKFDYKRLLSDAVYNVQMGSAELAGLLQDYRGSYVLTFAGYNAGRGRIQEWVKRYGDPRDPQVDPIDWVERIPFSETRYYVQRVMENMQVYRVRLTDSRRLMIEADLRRGASGN